MIFQLQPDHKIPLSIYDIAARHGVGMPLKRHQNRYVQIVRIVPYIMVLVAAWICYNIYASLAFISLSHTYPTADTVPAGLLDQYIWLQDLHDHFWTNLLQTAAPALNIWFGLSRFSSAFRTKVYICTEGLLTIYKKQEKTMRWDEIKEIYTTNGSVTRLVGADGSNLSLPFLLMRGHNQTTNLLILEEVMRHLLPEAQARYEHEGEITFGDLKVTRAGISRPGEQVAWDDLGAIELERNRLSLYYLQPGKIRREGAQSTTADAGKWHIWQKRENLQGFKESSWPNLPIFVELVRWVLDQRNIYPLQEMPSVRGGHTLKERATIARAKEKKKKRATIISVVATVIGLTSILIGFVVYQSVAEEQRVERDEQIIRQAIAQMAHKPYYAKVPGQDCDHGKATWLNDDTHNSFTCQQAGLLMTQKNFHYQDGEYFSFMPDYPWAYGHYIPAHYRVQVEATIVSGNTCVALEVHIQSFQGRQSFDICYNGNWFYSRCDLHCTTDTQVANGHLPLTGQTYVIAVDVTTTTLTLIVDNQTITSIQDNTYSAKDQLELAVYGDQNARAPVTARFANFLYTPYP